MTTTLSTVNGILKEVYQDRIEDQLNSETVALKRIERTSEGVTETVGGKYVDFPVHVKRNHGQGYRNEGDVLPAAGRQGYAEVHVPLRYGYGRVRINGQVMELAEKNHQAFASAMDREMEGLKDDLAKDSNRIVYGDGTGFMATITTGTAASTTQTVDNAQYLEEGMKVDIITKSNGAVLNANNEIVSVNPDTRVVTFATAFSPTANLQAIVRQGSYNLEPTGLAKIVNSTGVLHDLDPATQPKWAATVMSNGGTNRALSEGLMINACDKSRVKGGKISLILNGLGVRRAYFNLLTQQRRYTDTKEFAGGFTGLAFNHGTEIPVVEDVDCPPNLQYHIEEKHLKVYRSKPWHWMDRDGSVLKWVHDYDAYEAIMRQYWEIGTQRRNAHVVIKDITEG